MCLTLTENSEIKVAAEDIVCYKVVRKLCLGLYRSEFYAYLYGVGTLNASVFGVTITTRPYIVYQSITGRCVADYEQVVERGFHSFTCKEDAYKYAEYAASRIILDDINMVVVKCTIPKGATYIEGMYEKYPNYVSNKIICVEEV
jgi:hypothetical protein